MSVDFLNNLNPEQQQAVLHDKGPAMVLAGAGSGKTTVLTSRVAWLIQEKHVDPLSILLVTFTNKAAAEMRSRVQHLTNNQLPFSGTFHSLSAKILRQYGQVIGLPAGFLIYDSDEQLELIKQIYKQNGFSDKAFNPRAVKATISTAKNEMISAEQYKEVAYGQYQEHVSKVYKLYQFTLKKIGAVDFDDLLLGAVDLLQTQPQIREHFQQQLQYVLVDEYQDTNKAQYLFTKLMTKPQDNLFVVGDFSQSIYAWRGADYRNMLLLKTDFKNIKEYRLERNYRSPQVILDAATHVISHNTMHPILKLWTERQSADKITSFAANSREEESTQVVRYIDQLRSAYPLSEMAILYRTNAQSRSFEEAFVKAGIPYRVVGGQKFYERKEIKDTLAYLKLVVNQEDSVSHERILKLGKRRTADFIAWRDKVRESYQLTELEPAPLLKEILEVTHYLEKYDAHDPEDVSRLENIKELLNTAAQFPSLLQFLENIALIQNDYLIDSQSEEKNNVVTMMSLHAAKGLEFDVVFMVGMEDGTLPHSRSLLDKEQMEEERRLCYVGITRAKNLLYFTYARHSFSYQGAQSHIRSRFLNDIPEKLLIQEGESWTSSEKLPNRWASTAVPSKRRYVAVDDSELEAVLSGEMDIETFLND